MMSAMWKEEGVQSRAVVVPGLVWPPVPHALLYLDPLLAMLSLIVKLSCVHFHPSGFRLVPGG